MDVAPSTWLPSVTCSIADAESRITPISRRAAAGNDWTTFFFARKQLLLSARLSHRNSVCLSVTRVDQSKTVQAKITKSTPSHVRKTLVSGTVKLFYKFEGITPNEGAK